MGKTIAEKILGRHAARDVSAGEIVVADIDHMMSHDGNRPLSIQVFADEMGGTKLCDPQKFVMVIDHAPSSPTPVAANMHKLMRAFAREHGCLLYEAGEGSCHQLMPERGHALPGELVIGTDSHTCTYGAINVFSTGVGSSDMAAALVSGKLWFKVPETLRFVLNGTLPKGTFSKDLMLYLIGSVTADGATYRAAEYVGEAIKALSVDARFTISNMAVEMGAKVGLMEADEKTLAWLKGRATRPFEPVFSDADASFADVLEYDVSRLGPQVARPHQVDRVVPVEEVLGTPIQRANLVACTNSRLEDLEVAASIVAGKRIHPNLQFYVVPASKRVQMEALRRGILQTLLEAGAIMGVPGCDACSGGSCFGVGGDGENVITTANRNFRGRVANPEAFLYLASPATVAASALEGKIADPRKYLE
ncbi:MAG: 3-isopropylmalate dehydratase large subunit [Chloroflexota bacterium]